MLEAVVVGMVNVKSFVSDAGWKQSIEDDHAVDRLAAVAMDVRCAPW